MLTILLPPGALAEDSDVLITTLTPADWGVDTPGEFERLGEVYRVEPPGLLAGAAFAIVELPRTPESLMAADGDAAAMHFVWTGIQVRPAPDTHTTYLADGRVIIVARILELGEHWTGERIGRVDRSLVQLTARVTAQTGSHAVGSEWRWTEGSLHADGVLDVLSRRARVSVATAALGEHLVPLTDGSDIMRWSAGPIDGRRPGWWDVLADRAGLAPGATVSFEDRTPLTLTPAAPLEAVSDPLPGWACVDPDAVPASIFAGIDVVTGASDGAVTVGITRELGSANCAAP